MPFNKHAIVSTCTRGLVGRWSPTTSTLTIWSLSIGRRRRGRRTWSFGRFCSWERQQSGCLTRRRCSQSVASSPYSSLYIRTIDHCHSFPQNFHHDHPLDYVPSHFIGHYCSSLTFIFFCHHHLLIMITAIVIINNILIVVYPRSLTFTSLEYELTHVQLSASQHEHRL